MCTLAGPVVTILVYVPVCSQFLAPVLHFVPGWFILSCTGALAGVQVKIGVRTNLG